MDELRQSLERESEPGLVTGTLRWLGALVASSWYSWLLRPLGPASSRDSAAQMRRIEAEVGAGRGEGRRGGQKGAGRGRQGAHSSVGARQRGLLAGWEPAGLWFCWLDSRPLCFKSKEEDRLAGMPASWALHAPLPLGRLPPQ